MTKPLTGMPHYQCHKVVQALKIKEVRAASQNVEIVFEEDFPSLHVNLEWAASRKPEAGGYFVRYEDGYESFSPGLAFDSGYTRMDP